MADTGSAKAASAAGAQSLRFTDLSRSRFFAHVQTTRARVLAREYKRDSDGQFASGGGGSDDDDDGASGVPDPFDAPYAEYNLNDDGTPRFSQEYRDKYGTVTNEYGIGANNDHTVTVTDKGSLQVTDDSAGTENRVVVQEFTPAGARGLSDDINDVVDNGGSATNGKTGVTVQANGQTHPRGGYHGVDVTWANGTTSSFNPEESVELQEGLMFAAGGPSNRLPTIVNRVRDRLRNHPANGGTDG